MEGKVKEALVDLIKCSVVGCWVDWLAVALGPRELYEPMRHCRTSQGPWPLMDICKGHKD